MTMDMSKVEKPLDRAAQSQKSPLEPVADHQQKHSKQKRPRAAEYLKHGLVP